MFLDYKLSPVADPENFGGGDFKHNTSKIWMSNTEIETNFSAEIELSNVFYAQNQVVSKTKKKGSSPRLRLNFRPKSLGLGWWGGCIQNVHPPPPKSATG